MILKKATGAFGFSGFLLKVALSQNNGTVSKHTRLAGMHISS